MTTRIDDSFTGHAANPNFVAKHITADGRCIPVVPKDGKYFSYEELTDFVGGDIEIAYPPSSTGACIVCNEDGKRLGLRPNELATKMWQEHAEPGSPRMSDPIVGDILLCHHTQLE
jgi:hypothetical protein